jgi:hypothetical protein
MRIRRCYDCPDAFERYQIEGHYPEMLDPAPTRTEAAAEMARAEELLSWLMAKY